MPSDRIDAASLDYRKIISAGDRMIWTQGVGEPLTCLETLLDQVPELPPFGAFLGASYSGLFTPERVRAGPRLTTMGAVGTNRRLCESNATDILPCHLSELPHLLRSGAMKIDIVIMQLAPPCGGSSGYSLGAVNGYVQFAMERARLAIAEVNSRAPWTYASEQIDLSRFDIVVETDRPPVEVGSREPSATDRLIARNIATFVEDGATIQIGIGTLPGALLGEISDRRHLGLHSGVIGNAVIPLIESGAIDNSRKPAHRGVSVTGGLIGDQALNDFAHNNRELLVEPVTITHDQAYLASLPKLVSVNSVLEVDLTGQASSEVAQGRYIGTIGGQIDFIRGAMASPGGRSIVALSARTPKGEPRIVPRLSSGIATCGRADADTIVTEYGSAELRGKTISERVRSMIAVAHPDDRDDLSIAAREIAGYR